METQATEKEHEAPRGRLQRRISGRTVRIFFVGSVFLLLLGLGAGWVTLRALSRDLPSPARLQTIKPPIKTLVFAANGDTLHEYFRENRIPIRLADAPVGLVHAIIATEDRGFYDHYGIELKGWFRAMWINLKERRAAQGASTLTQQLARSLFLHPRKEWTRKIREILLALQIERTYTKDEILEMYLNAIYFGPAYGVEAASIAFFGKSVRDLQPAEYTLLAGVLNNPGYYSPFRHLDRAYQRRAIVLRSMVREGYLSPEQAEIIGQTEVVIRKDERERRIAPYFVEAIRQYLESHYGVKQLYEDGLRVYTTLDPDIQVRAEDALEAHLSKIEEQEAYPQTKALYDSLYAQADDPPLPEYIQGAVLVIDPHTGAVRAMVGGRDFDASEFNRAVQAPRQPGSVFKAFLYATAIQRGWTAASVLLDAPVEIDTGSDELWKPVNFDNTFRGEIPLRYALAHSINVPAVRLIMEVGTQPVIQLAHRMGIESPIPDVYSIALGAGDATLMELSSAYAVFANNGIRTRPFLFTRITNSRGDVLEESHVYQEEVLDERVNYMMVDLMRTALREGTGRAARSYGFDRDGAGKTGTTDRYTDAWFIGYTPDLVCGVWVGFDTPTSMGKRKTGAVMALPIWANVMVPTVATMPPSVFPRPEGIVERLVCEASGQRPAAACQQIRSEIFVEGMEPSRTCEIHQPVSQDVRDQAGDFQEIDANAARREFGGGGRR
jgi:penicillin-binding protein 1A